jgi:hypothetical protein
VIVGVAPDEFVEKSHNPFYVKIKAQLLPWRKVAFKLALLPQFLTKLSKETIAY